MDKEKCELCGKRINEYGKYSVVIAGKKLTQRKKATLDDRTVILYAKKREKRRNKGWKLVNSKRQMTC